METETETGQHLKKDPREFRTLKLLESGLNVLIIQDPSTKLGAACVELSVGSSSDPNGCEGIAHLLEHMLFSRSVKYPKEGGFGAFVNQNGGNYCAHTGFETTMFYFEIAHQNFTEALDRFSQFFVNPVITKEAVCREVNILESEFRLHSQSEEWREKGLQQFFCKDGHPFRKFSKGNHKTLRNNQDFKVFEEVQRFCKFYYNAEKMRLVISSGGKLEETQTMVNQMFRVPKPSDWVEFILREKIQGFPLKDPVCSRDNMQIYIEAVSISHGDKLILEWPITSTHVDQNWTRLFLGYWMHRGSRGSLIDKLKKKGLMYNLYANVDEISHHLCFFKLTIEMTPKGQKSYQDIVQLVFKYIHFIERVSCSPWMYSKLRSDASRELGRISSNVMDFLMFIAKNMHVYKSQKWTQGPLNDKPPLKEIVKSLEDLSPRNMRIYMFSKDFEGLENLKEEPWWSIMYTMGPIPHYFIKEYENRDADRDFIVGPMTDNYTQKDVSEYRIPEVIRTTPYSKLWYEPYVYDDFCRGLLQLRLDIQFPSSDDIQKKILSRIFVRLLMDHLNGMSISLDEAACFSPSLYTKSNGFEIIVDAQFPYLDFILTA